MGSEDLNPNNLWSEIVKRQHASEWADGWQYASVWRFVPRDVPAPHEFEPLGPPEGEGWELNVDKAPDARSVISPAQPDKLMQLTHWRRPHPGLRTDHPKHKISRQVDA